jgi:hypothetical protein
MFTEKVALAPGFGVLWCLLNARMRPVRIESRVEVLNQLACSNVDDSDLIRARERKVAAPSVR